MSLASGTRLGAHEVVAQLGEDRLSSSALARVPEQGRFTGEMSMRGVIVTNWCVFAAALALAAQVRTGTLTVYYIDTEGGQSQQDGSFTVTNTRNAFSKTYGPRP